jgi:NAD(P)-dependent dehydrogenase (short-subunit alcohol dehydrogenase family)
MQETILISGASNGFGKDAALTMAAAGHLVLGRTRDPAGRTRDTAGLQSASAQRA